MPRMRFVILPTPWPLASRARARDLPEPRTTQRDPSKVMPPRVLSGTLAPSLADPADFADLAGHVVRQASAVTPLLSRESPEGPSADFAPAVPVTASHLHLACMNPGSPSSQVNWRLFWERRASPKESPCLKV